MCVPFSIPKVQAALLTSLDCIIMPGRIDHLGRSLQTTGRPVLSSTTGRTLAGQDRTTGRGYSPHPKVERAQQIDHSTGRLGLSTTGEFALSTTGKLERLESSTGYGGYGTRRSTDRLRTTTLGSDPRELGNTLRLDEFAPDTKKFGSLRIPGRTFDTSWQRVPMYGGICASATPEQIAAEFQTVEAHPAGDFTVHGLQPAGDFTRTRRGLEIKPAPRSPYGTSGGDVSRPDSTATQPVRVTAPRACGPGYSTFEAVRARQAANNWSHRLGQRGA